MATYTWKGTLPSGKITSGELVAENQAAVVAALRARKIIVSSIREKPREIHLPLLGGGKVRSRDLAVFTRQFATMINSGLPLVSCLEIQSRQVEKETFRKVLREVMHDVEGGMTLAEALRKQKRVFSDLYVNMVEAGEAGGALDIILVRLANYLEKAEALARKIKGAMIYPAIVVTIAIAATAIILVAVIPTFANMFISMGAELPLPTRIVIALSNFVRHWFIAGIIGAVALVVGLRFFYRSPRGRLTLDRILLRVPVLGTLIQKSAIARFSRTLGTLLSSGVSILEALEITARTAGNQVVQNAVMEARASISEGATIAGPLENVGVFPPMVVQMISIGEATGGLDEMLNKIADFYDTEVDQAVENLTSALEPIIIVFLGVIVGGMVIAMYLPIFKIVTLIH
ncbi:pilus assembly protein PilC [candidate division TA06 bacterium DG_24]|uniref:Pilus assembly protein PilC n=3 Tax=Bacteria division TA06 TaxID=1156500 RepID=A0A0S8JL15_UNCT6|nr:MAG: pilus assembly protein PilC [candidate division TA06 bacterium DG_24]KPK69899.1 MAG: pilus assembly protein PilC [candidate division TA06 bacterium SM23_40]KPL09291.1 MAG: pilus assembly protein PilC [candidate division TA06 bacterium SM1_40]